jgi:hypothetical protein
MTDYSIYFYILLVVVFVVALVFIVRGKKK